jgi:arylsulfatase A-like enzyme
MTKEDIQTEKNQYEGAIAYIDQQIGILYDELERRDLTKNTVIILVSDHGEQFGEHRFIAEVGDFHKQTLQYKHYLREHANSLYIQAIHVPLVILYPRSVPLEKIIDMPISLRDIAMTVLDLTNLGKTGQFPGTSLAKYWQDHEMTAESYKEVILSEINQGPPRFEPWAPSKKGDMKSLVNSRYHYILNGDGSEEIYDFMQDPLEAENLMSSAQGNQMLSEFRGSLRAVLARSQGQGD